MTALTTSSSELKKAYDAIYAILSQSESEMTSPYFHDFFIGILSK